MKYRMSDDESAKPEMAGIQVGARWRVLAHDGDERIELENVGRFDELVVDDWLHIEQMSEREWLLALGNSSEVAILIRIKDDGKVGLEMKIHGASSVLVPQEQG